MSVNVNFWAGDPVCLYFGTFDPSGTYPTEDHHLCPSVARVLVAKGIGLKISTLY